MDKEKYWLKFILSGKPEDYIKYSQVKLQDKAVEDYSFFDRRISNSPEQYR